MSIEPKIIRAGHPMDGPFGPVLYARKGEEIVCEAGHVICEVGQNIWFGQPYEKGHLVNWMQDEPKLGTPPGDIRCRRVVDGALCGAEWYRRGQVFHFREGGWRYFNAEGLFRGQWPDRPKVTPGGLVIPRWRGVLRELSGGQYATAGSGGGVPPGQPQGRLEPAAND